jgi:hypothetical protein
VVMVLPSGDNCIAALARRPLDRGCLADEAVACDAVWLTCRVSSDQWLLENGAS